MYLLQHHAPICLKLIVSSEKQPLVQGAWHDREEIEYSMPRKELVSIRRRRLCRPRVTLAVIIP